MTTIVKAKMQDGTTKEMQAVFPQEIDPRFDFCRSPQSLKAAHRARIDFLRDMEPEAKVFSVASIDDNPDLDLDLVEQPRMNGQADLLVGAAKDWS
jgi:hypothetical protein